MRFLSQPLNSVTGGRPVFFLPPHGAGGLEYYPFRHFFAAVRAPLFGFDVVYAPTDRLDEWVESLGQEIIRMSAGRDCDLLAWGHGAALAPLLGKGLSRARLLLFDPIPPHGYDRWDRFKIWLRLRLVGLPPLALEFLRWLRGQCNAAHLKEFAAAQLVHGYWLPRQLQAHQWTRYQLSPAEIYSARAAFRVGTAHYVPRACGLETHFLLSRNRLQRSHQWQPYLSGQLYQLERSTHDFSPMALAPVAVYLNQLPE